MAARRPALAVLALAAAGVWLLRFTLAPAFAVTTVDANGRYRFVVAEAPAAAPPAPAPAPAAPAPAPAAPAPVPAASAPVPARPRICEIFVTNPSVGMRTRMSVTDDTPVESIIPEARKAFGFDQEWISDSDFKVYRKEDESTPITGTMGEHGLKPWGPDGTELHIFFEPSS
mmetsp:Transcript_72807/g.168766  ORF Transcript_72807/g.168766 Transcript_72807/m.168766 type:complete len:172 (+) Transcript_72807:69-584(+)